MLPALAKLGVASLGALLLLWGWWLRRSGHPDRHHRQRDALLLALGVLGAICWGNFLQFRPGFVHGSDAFHYYFGAKYFRELGYTRLYRCAALADSEDGLGERVRTRSVRDLETDRLAPGGQILAEPHICAAHFSPERWIAFKQDIRWFRERMDPALWERIFQDYGYNATPVWAALGTPLANTGPASWTQIVLLVALDPVILIAMWSAVGWAFGWRAMCVAMIYWGTNYPARFAWTGGSILRQDWLALSMVGLCLLRRGHPGSAGFSLTWATLLRVFPASLLAGIGLKPVARRLTRRPLESLPRYRRLALGCALAVVVLVPLGSAVAGGWHAWVGFTANSLKHVSTPTANRIGLATLAAYDHEHRARVVKDAPGPSWEEARRQTLNRRRPLFIAAAAAFLVMLGWAVREQPDWVAAVLGVGLIAGTGEATCYYYSILSVYGLIGNRREGIGAALCALSAAGAVMGMFAFYDDELYALLSAATLLFIVGATIALGRHPFEPAGDFH
jgi:hypothetical protein